MRALRFPMSMPGALLRLSGGLKPETPFYAIGDIHGRADLLRRLLRLIKDDAQRHNMGPFQLVFLGDYIDRGYASAGVLQMIYRLSQRNPGWVTCLLGNHERMLLDFLDAPEQHGPGWLGNGGRWTLESYGISVSDDAMARPHYPGLARSLKKAMPLPIRNWLATRPLGWTSGNVICVHAATDPERPLDAQSPETLLWGHPRFRHQKRSDGTWVVHGHTIVAAPRVEEGKVSVDTGAYATGRLSAMAITPDGRTRALTTGA